MKVKVYSFDRKTSINVVLENINERQYHSIQKGLLAKLETEQAYTAIAHGFIHAVTLCPKANPSDLWQHIIYRTFIESGRNEQSWKRASGQAFENALVEIYNLRLIAYGIRLVVLSSTTANQALVEMGLVGKIAPSKMDIAIAGNCNDKMPKEQVKTQQQRMLESSNRLSNIVNDLLDAMELEGGYLNFEFAPTDLGEMITAIMQELQPNYDRKGLYIKLVQPKEPLPKIEIEPKYLREALENFIDNAEKYTNKGGTTVTLSRKNNHAIISITDTGIGIPKTDMPKLFQKFSRGEKSTYQHTDGSGLGLFIAKNIIDEHRGTINIDSPGEGKGTTITVTLPLTQPSLPKNNNKK